MLSTAAGFLGWSHHPMTNISKDAPCHLNLCTGPAPQNWRSQGAPLADLQSKECVHGEGEKWWEGERRTKTTKQKRKGKKKRRGGKNSEAGLFLSSLPSIQCQQGRSTTVASHGAQKTWQACFSWWRAEWTGGWWQLQRGQCELSALIGCFSPKHPASRSLTACTGCSKAPAMEEISACRYFS